MTINAIFNLCTKNVESLDENGEEDYKKLRTLMVIGDIECLIEYDVEGRNVLVADLIRYATEDDPENVSHAFSGDNCIEQFINKLNDLTEVVGKENSAIS